MVEVEEAAALSHEDHAAIRDMSRAVFDQYKRIRDDSDKLVNVELPGMGAWEGEMKLRIALSLLLALAGQALAADGDVQQMREDLARIDAVANGGPTETVATRGGPVKTVAHAIADLAAFTPRGAWAPGTDYALKDLVTQGGQVYVCAAAHASADFAADLAAGRWALHVRKDGFQRLGDHADSLSAAATAAGATGTVLVDRPVTASADAVIEGELWFTREGSITVAPGKTLTVNGPVTAGPWQIFRGAVAGSPKVERVLPQWFGAKGDGTTDDTAAWQKTINAAMAFKAPIFVPAGTYKLSGTIAKAQSFECPSIVGAGKYKTILDWGGYAGSGIKLVGGSGQHALAEIKGMTLKNAATLLEIAGQCGVSVRDCFFDACDVGLLFHNAAAGSFTEHCVADSCEFNYDCKTALEYRRSGGNESFHGSGLRECLINERPTSTTRNIKIGAGCFVYNAPLSFTIWKQNTRPVIHVSSSVSRAPYMLGDIKVECYGIKSNFDVVDSSAGYLLLVGSLSSLNQFAKFGNLYLANSVSYQRDGFTNGRELKPYGKTYSINATPFIFQNALPGEAMLMHVVVTRANYMYVALLLLDVHPLNNANGAVAVLYEKLWSDAAGYGKPAWSYGGGPRIALNAAQAALGDTKAYVKYSPVGSAFSTWPW